MDAHNLKVLLLNQLEDVLVHLLPNGKRHGNYWHVGSIEGEAGNSLRVCLSGAKRGVWMDGAEGNDGDILDLWGQVNNHDSFRAALPEIKEYLGVPDHKISNTDTKPYKAPAKEYDEIDDVSLDYLHDKRGIDFEAIERYGVLSHMERSGVIAFPYYNPRGKVKMVKYLKPETIGVKKKIWCSPETMPILFGMNAINGSRSLVITEGEIDALSFASQGIPAASVPFGAKGDDEKGESPNDEWISNSYEWLEQFETIYLCMDNDEPGKAATESLIPRLGRERTKIIELGKYKDANEAHVNDAQLTEFLKEAKTRDPDDLKVASSLMDKVWHTMRGGRREEQGIKLFGWDLYPEGHDFKIRPREGTIITGYDHAGKSNFAYQLFAWLAAVQDITVFIGSYEEGADQILSIIASHIHGRHLDKNEFKLFKKTSPIFDKIIIHTYEGIIPDEEFFNYAEYAVKRYGAQVTLLDSLATTTIDVDDKKEMDIHTKKAQSFWKRSGVHHFEIAHARKGYGQDSEANPPKKSDVKGSKTYTDLFFNCITLHRPPEGEDLGYTAELVVSKQKVGGRLSRTHLQYDEDSYRLYQDYEKERESWI